LATAAAFFGTIFKKSGKPTTAIPSGSLLEDQPTAAIPSGSLLEDQPNLL